MDFKNQVFPRRIVQLQERSQLGRIMDKRKNAFLVQCDEKNEIWTYQREQDPKVPVRKVKQAGIPVSKGAMPKQDPHVRVGTHWNAHTTNPQVDASGR